MGMYTELHLAVELKEDTPEDVMNILKYMPERGEKEAIPVPDHPLFKTERWSGMLNSGSCSFPVTCSRLTERKASYSPATLLAHFNIKNYSGEIEAFLDWIMPHIDASYGQFIGYRMYEEDEHPTILYKDVPMFETPKY